MNVVRKTLVLVSAWLCLGTASMPARGAVVIAMDFDELAAEADRVVVGEVVAISARWSEEKRIIETVVEVRVEIELSAMSAEPAVRIVQPGGQIGDVGLVFPGMPVFHQGERALLFLRVTGSDPDGVTTHAVVGMAQGKLAVVPRLGGGFDVMQDYPAGLALAYPDEDGALHVAADVRPIVLDLEEALARIRCVRGEVSP